MSVKLRMIINDDDLFSLYRMMNSGDRALFAITRGDSSFGVFKERMRYALTTDYHDFFLVERNQIVGFVYNFDFSLQDGHCQIVTYIKKGCRQLGYGVVATASFMKYLYEKYPIRKIYTTVYGYNVESLNLNAKRGTFEGSIENFRYYKGRYWGLNYFSISREQFLSSMIKYAVETP